MSLGEPASKAVAFASSSSGLRVAEELLQSNEFDKFDGRSPVA
jgi:hypothetical protein